MRREEQGIQSLSLRISMLLELSGCQVNSWLKLDPALRIAGLETLCRRANWRYPGPSLFFRSLLAFGGTEDHQNDQLFFNRVKTVLGPSLDKN